MMPLIRVVLDTNVLVSALLSPHSTPGQATRAAMETCTLLASEATLAEIEEVLRKPKLAKLLSRESCVGFQLRYREAVRIVPVAFPVHVCRDARDDKFLEVAVNGQADLIITGDEDLLALDAFQGVRILTPQAYLASFPQSHP